MIFENFKAKIKNVDRTKNRRTVLYDQHISRLLLKSVFRYSLFMLQKNIYNPDIFKLKVCVILNMILKNAHISKTAPSNSQLPR